MGNTSHDNPKPESRGRGFASMDPQRQKEIASKGGKSAHAKGTAHEFSCDEAREAGRRGGMVVSQNRPHMAEIGGRGGHARGRKQAAARAARLAAETADKANPANPQESENETPTTAAGQFSGVIPEGGASREQTQETESDREKSSLSAADAENMDDPEYLRPVPLEGKGMEGKDLQGVNIRGSDPATGHIAAGPQQDEQDEESDKDAADSSPRINPSKGGH
jgi:general stress protein YciG